MRAMDEEGLPPERVGEAVKTALTESPPNVRYIVDPVAHSGFRRPGAAETVRGRP